MGGFTALCPAKGKLHGIPRLLLSRWMGRTLIKDHHNITAQLPLDLLDFSEKHRTAIHRGWNFTPSSLILRISPK